MSVKANWNGKEKPASCFHENMFSTKMQLFSTKMSNFPTSQKHCVEQGGREGGAARPGLQKGRIANRDRGEAHQIHLLL